MKLMKNIRVIILFFTLSLGLSPQMYAFGDDDFFLLQNPFSEEKMKSGDFEIELFGGGFESNGYDSPLFKVKPPKDSGFNCPFCGGEIDCETGLCEVCAWEYGNGNSIATEVPITDGLYVILFCCLVYVGILLRKKANQENSETSVQ
jgi:hypothetical protein